MTREIPNRVARVLATLLMVLLMIAPAHAETLALPKSGAEPVALMLSDTTRSENRSSELLQVFVGTEVLCCTGRTPIAGRYAQTGDTLAFSPAFGFEPGQDYVARILTAHGEELVPFSIPAAVAAVPAAVTEVYPSGDTLPENVLRFYIHFSVPMTPHVAFNYITLRDTYGVTDEAAFMRFKQELWNEDRTRLTVLIDPGRIKREVATNVELGPALLAGQRYTLSVDGGWTSADGTSVLPAFTRAFRVSEALRERPDTRLWTVNTPCAGTRDPLTVSFDRPFDRHLLTQALRLKTATGLGLDGAVQIGDQETTWSFKPHQPWPEEELHLVANPVLEDVAGNNFRDLLDHFAGPQEIDPSSTSLPIRIRDCAG
ncbi:MAG: hypothetical protein QNJ09_14995 [Paracoccaceae bacterium]|nr:hypothetical protein [Paracoccaceae bacterium]